jgi:hypothetical protein
MLIAVIWVTLAIIIGAAARARGRSGVGWFLLAVVLSPLIAGLLLIIFPDLRTHALLADIRSASSVDDRALSRNLEGKRRRPRLRVGWLLMLAAIVAVAVGAWILDRP